MVVVREPVVQEQYAGLQTPDQCHVGTPTGKKTFASNDDPVSLFFGKLEGNLVVDAGDRPILSWANNEQVTESNAGRIRTDQLQRYKLALWKFQHRSLVRYPFHILSRRRRLLLQSSHRLFPVTPNNAGAINDSTK